MTRDAVIAAIAAPPYGIVTAAQLLELGMDSKAITRRVRSGRLFRIHPGFYAVGHPRLGDAARRMAALLCTPGEAAMSHATAAHVLRLLPGRPPASIHVTTTSRSRSKPGVTVHRTRWLDPCDVTERDGIPVTTPARTIVDLAQLYTEYQLARVLHEAAFRRQLDIDAIDSVNERLCGRASHTVVRRAVALNLAGSAGTRSTFEDRFITSMRRRRIGGEHVNGRVQAAGRTFEVDLYWPRERVVVELDGPGHSRPRSAREDAERDRALRAAGIRVMRIGPEDLDHFPEPTFAELQRLLRGDTVPENAP